MSRGIRDGVRMGLVTTIVLATIAIAVVWRVRIALPPVPHGVTNVTGVVAGAIGLAWTTVFVLTVDEEHAG